MTLKEQATERIKSCKLPASKCKEADARLYTYLLGLKKYPERHNAYELLAGVRFVKLMERYEWRPLAVKRFIVFYEYLQFPGKKGKERYKLTPVQVFQFASIMGFYHKGSDKRLTREALLFVPRKFSKTTSVAALAVYDLLYGDSNAQCYVAANSYKQAQICFAVIKSVLKNLDPKLRRFKVNREKVYNLMAGKTSFAECLASHSDALDGLNASTVILDEYSQSESADLKNVLTSSMGARLNPLTIVITTASDKTATPFYEMLSLYKSILRGEVENDSVFAHIFEPDEGDDEGDPDTWRKVQPHIGVTVYEDFYESEWNKARLSSSDMKAFRNKLLNIFAEDSAKSWIEGKEIEALYLPEGSVEDYRNVRAVCSVDLSVVDDFSAVTYLLYMPGRVVHGREVSVPFHSITEYYFPKGQIGNHPNSELYKRWAEYGYLNLVEGDVIDYRRIVEDILSKPFAILGIGYDKYKAREFIQMLEYTPGVGKQFLYDVPQTYGAFTSPVESLELTLYRRQITFERNPITAYCFDNAVIDEDKLENRKPIKRQPLGKIDGCITNVMCFWLMQNVAVGF